MESTSETQNPAAETEQTQEQAPEASAEAPTVAEPQRGAHGLPVGSQVPLTLANAEARERDRERADEANDLAEATAKMIRNRGKRGGGRRERKDLRG